MEGKRFIALSDLSEVLLELSAKLEVWIPAAAHKEKTTVEFLRFRAGTAPVLDRQATLPPRKVLLPQVETLLRFEYGKNGEEPSKTTIRLEERPNAVGRALVFGARPCDVRGFLTMDRVFTGGPYVDPYYKERREKTLFAALVCREGDGACFCSSVGGGPADMEGSDLRLTPVEGGLVVEQLSGRAEGLFDALGRAASGAEEEEAKRVLGEVSGRRVGDLEVKGCGPAFLKRFEDKGYWRDMASSCLSCGVCAYVCPTCYCFTITDETKNLRGERMRSWDSCMFSNYTSEASGHNPRPTKLERYRNRVGHKFSYIPERYEGLIGCCGCGRCIRSCPVSIDIRRVVERLKEEKACERQ
jgi:ferredoxin